MALQPFTKVVIWIVLQCLSSVLSLQPFSSLEDPFQLNTLQPLLSYQCYGSLQPFTLCDWYTHAHTLNLETAHGTKYHDSNVMDESRTNGNKLCL